MQAGEAEGPLRDPGAGQLHRVADRATDRSEVLGPVAAAPHLEPVDHELESTVAPHGGGREQREVRKRIRVHDVVATPMASEMPQHAEAEQEGWADPAPPAGRVQRQPRLERDDGHPRVDVDARAAVPLASSQVGDLVALAHETLGQVAIPALAAADGVGKQAVIDDADAHGHGQIGTVAPGIRSHRLVGSRAGTRHFLRPRRVTAMAPPTRPRMHRDEHRRADKRPRDTR